MTDPTIGGELHPLQRFSSRRAFRVMRIVKEVMEAYPELVSDMQAFVRKYEEENVVKVDRATAMFRFGPERLKGMSEDDWMKSGNTLKLPRSPGLEEQLLHIFPKAFDKAEEQVLRLCAVVAMANGEVKRAHADGGQEAVDKLISARAEELVDDTEIDELIELFVAGAELAEDQIGDKIRALQERLGNVRKLFGFERPESASEKEPPAGTTDEPSTDPDSEREDSPTKPPLSSSSDEPSDGGPTPPSTPTGSSSLSSVPG